MNNYHFSNKTFIENANCHFPCRKQTYSNIIGKLHETVTFLSLLDIGEETKRNFRLIPHKVNSNGVDCILSDNETHDHLGIEIAMLGKNSYITEYRAKCIKRNLRGYDFKILIVYGYLNLQLAAKSLLKGIRILHIPFYVIPKHWLEWYKTHSNMKRKCVDNNSTRSKVTKRIFSFFSKIGLVLPLRKCMSIMYYFSCVDSVSNVSVMDSRVESVVWSVGNNG